MPASGIELPCVTVSSEQQLGQSGPPLRSADNSLVLDHPYTEVLYIHGIALLEARQYASSLCSASWRWLRCICIGSQRIAVPGGGVEPPSVHLFASAHPSKPGVQSSSIQTASSVHFSPNLRSNQSFASPLAGGS